MKIEGYPTSSIVFHPVTESWGVKPIIYFNINFTCDFNSFDT